MPTVGTRIRTGVLALAVAAMSAIFALQPPAAEATAACAPDPVLCPERMYVGASVDGLPSNPGSLDPFIQATGVSPSVAMFFAGFSGRVDTTALRRLSDTGRLPMMTWEPWDHTTPSANPYSLQAIASGQFDAYLSAQGRALASVGAPVAVRFAHEMNGGWYPWGQGANGNTPSDYVAAYRRVHDVVTAAGATNVIWVWSPITVVSRPSVPLAPLYPGDGYVDWVGLSVYFSSPTATYVKTVPSTLSQLDQVAPAKPIYVAETAVLPGANRPAMIHDLITGLLSMPRLVGLTWFNYVSQYDYRVDNDPPAAAQLGADLASSYFGGAGHVNDPVLAPPVALTFPTIPGDAQVGGTLTGGVGTWRSGSGSGNLTTTDRWYRCTDATTTSSCTATGATGATYPPSTADLGQFLRLAETATNEAGSTLAWSAPTDTVLMTPATPAPPAVEDRDGALHLAFPAAPAGTTHWQVSLNGTTRPLVPVGTADYWLTGLTNGTSYTLSLAAAKVTATTTATVAAVGPATAGTAVPMTTPWNPYLKVSGTTVTVKLPTQAPTGATGWQLTIGTVTRNLPLTTTSIDVTGLTPGQDTPWALRATAGNWNGQPGLSLPATGAITAQ
jgi:hypothetical protein